LALNLDVKTQMLKFTKRLKGVVENASSKEVMQEVGNEAVRLIGQQAKLGKDYKSGNKFKSLSSSYIQKRQKNASDLHKRTRPRKSNVTATGQMIDSLKVSKVMEKSVDVSCSGSRYESAFDNGKLSNAEVAYYVEKAGRHFLGLSDKSKEKIRKFYSRIVRTILRRQR
jgi:hypothetical protein